MHFKKKTPKRPGIGRFKKTKRHGIGRSLFHDDKKSPTPSTSSSEERELKHLFDFAGKPKPRKFLEVPSHGDYSKKNQFPRLGDSSSSESVKKDKKRRDSMALMLEALKLQKEEIQTKYDDVNSQLDQMASEKQESMRVNEDLRTECGALRDESIKMLKIKVTDDDMLRELDPLKIKYNLLIDQKEEMLRKNEELSRECGVLTQRQDEMSKEQQRTNKFESKYDRMKRENRELNQECTYLKQSMHEQKFMRKLDSKNGLQNNKQLQELLRDNNEIREIYECVSWKLTKANEKYNKLKRSKSKAADYIESLDNLQKQYDDLLVANDALREKYESLKQRYDERSLETERYREAMDNLQAKYDLLKTRQRHKKVQADSRFVSESITDSNTTFDHLLIANYKDRDEYIKALAQNHQRFKSKKQRQIDSINERLQHEMQKNMRSNKSWRHHRSSQNVQTKRWNGSDGDSDGLMDQILALKGKIEAYVEDEGEICDSVTIIGKSSKFKNVQIFANERGLQIGSDLFEYKNIFSLFRSKDSETEWILTTNNYMVQILASSARQRDRFVSYIQSKHIHFL